MGIRYKIKGLYCWRQVSVNILFVCFIGLLVLFSLFIYNKFNKELAIHKQIESELISKIDSLETRKYEKMRCTYYVLKPSQTDSRPLETADGTNHDLAIINKYRHCAVSPDRLKDYPLGTVIIIAGLQKELNGVWMVRDVTAKKIKNTIDLMLPNGKNKPITNSCFISKV